MTRPVQIVGLDDQLEPVWDIERAFHLDRGAGVDHRYPLRANRHAIDAMGQERVLLAKIVLDAATSSPADRPAKRTSWSISSASLIAATISSRRGPWQIEHKAA
jgi:hypothetical protein